MGDLFLLLGLCFLGYRFQKQNLAEGINFSEMGAETKHKHRKINSPPPSPMGDLVTGAKQTSFSSDKRDKHLDTNAKAKEMHWVYVTRKKQVRMLEYEKSANPPVSAEKYIKLTWKFTIESFRGNRRVSVR